MTIPHVTYQIPSYGSETSLEPSSREPHIDDVPELGPRSREERVGELALIGKDIYALREQYIANKQTKKSFGRYLVTLLLGSAPKSASTQTRDQYMRQLVNSESAIGDAIVGREDANVIAQHFFLSHIADNEWIWRQHERGKDKPQTINYILQPDEGVIYRVLDSELPVQVSDIEFEHIWLAINQYKADIIAKIYSPDQAR